MARTGVSGTCNVLSCSAGLNPDRFELRVVLLYMSKSYLNQKDVLCAPWDVTSCCDWDQGKHDCIMNQFAQPDHESTVRSILSESRLRAMEKFLWGVNVFWSLHSKSFRISYLWMNIRL